MRLRSTSRNIAQHVQKVSYQYQYLEGRQEANFVFFHFCAFRRIVELLDPEKTHSGRHAQDFFHMRGRASPNSLSALLCSNHSPLAAAKPTSQLVSSRKSPCFMIPCHSHSAKYLQLHHKYQNRRSSKTLTPNLSMP